MGPENWLLEMFKKARLSQEERELATSPMNLLAEISRCSRAKQSLKEGIFTEKLLEERSRYCRFWQVESAAISPLSLFPFKANRCILLQPAEKSQGMTTGPESLLKERSRTRRSSLGASFAEEEGYSRRLPERLRDFKPEQEPPKLERSETEPERLFPERSKAVNNVLHLDPGVKETVPLRLVNLRERVSRWSRERRKAETRLKFACRGMELRSMEEITVESLQEMPVKAHGFWLGSQLERMVGSRRLALKLMSCWVSLLLEDEVGEA